MRFLKLGDIPLKNKASSKARTMFLSCSTNMAWPELSGYGLRKKMENEKKKNHVAPCQEEGFEWVGKHRARIPFLNRDNAQRTLGEM